MKKDETEEKPFRDQVFTMKLQQIPALQLMLYLPEGLSVISMILMGILRMFPVNMPFFLLKYIHLQLLKKSHLIVYKLKCHCVWNWYESQSQWHKIDMTSNVQEKKLSYVCGRCIGCKGLPETLRLLLCFINLMNYLCKTSLACFFKEHFMLKKAFLLFFIRVMSVGTHFRPCIHSP